MGGRYESSMARRLTPRYTCHHVTIPGQGSQALIITEDTVTSGDHSANVVTSAVKRSIGSTIGFHNHGEGPY